MAIAVRQVGVLTEHTSGSPPTTITIAVPSATQNGDVLVAFIAENWDSVVPPAGWTALQHTGQVGVCGSTFYRVATGSEPADYTFTNISPPDLGIMVAFSGVDNVNVLDTTPTQRINTTTFSSGTVAITTATNNAMVVAAGFTIGATRAYGPWYLGIDSTLLTEIYEDSSSVIISLGIATYTKPTAGSTDRMDYTVAPWDTNIGNLFALKPSINTTITGAAALTGTGSLTATGGITKVGEAALAGTSSFSADGTVTRFGVAALSGTSSLTVIGAVLNAAGALLTGSGTLIAVGDTTGRFGQAALTGVGSLTASGDSTGRFGQAVLAGVGSLSVTPTVTEDPASVARQQREYLQYLRMMKKLLGG